MIRDDATSNLDADTEKNLNQQIAEIQGVTVSARSGFAYKYINY